MQFLFADVTFVGGQIANAPHGLAKDFPAHDPVQFAKNRRVQDDHNRSRSRRHGLIDLFEKVVPVLQFLFLGRGGQVVDIPVVVVAFSGTWVGNQLIHILLKFLFDILR